MKSSILVAWPSLWLVSALAVAQPAKQKIEKLDDLPRHTYPISGTVTELLTSAEQFATLAKAVRHDVETDLTQFEIADRPTLRRLEAVLMALDLLEDRREEAAKRVQTVRNLEDKPAAKLLSGLVAESWLSARAQHQDTTADAFRESFRQHYRQHLDALPWTVVEAEVKSIKGTWEIRSRNLLLGVAQSQLDPAVKDSKQLSLDLAETVVTLRLGLEVTLPLKDDIVSSLTRLIDAHHVTKPDIWATRNVTLDANRKSKPVVVGIWDSGVDVTLFPGRVFTNPRERLDGRDSDRNGFVDDVHGIAFDLHAERVPELLLPLADAQSRLPTMKSDLKGFEDLQAALDSPEASSLKQRMAAIEPDKVKPFIEDLNLFAAYVHGTHVAGIAAEGNPFIRLLPARLTFDHRLIPEKPTLEQAYKDAAAYQAAVDYFKKHAVRVVNMSWGTSLKDVESSLEANGVGDATERTRQAREIFKVLREGLTRALQSAPKILFVIAAGNSDNDVQFEDVIPSSIRLSNVLTAGAVDKAGDPTSFTSFGENVVVYANGYEVDSTIPGGDRLRLSGTSMAAPNTTNLAAKLLALDPGRKPAEIIRLIVEGADASPANPRIRLLNPARSLAMLHH